MQCVLIKEKLDRPICNVLSKLPKAKLRAPCQIHALWKLLRLKAHIAKSQSFQCHSSAQSSYSSLRKTDNFCSLNSRHSLSLLSCTYLSLISFYRVSSIYLLLLIMFFFSCNCSSCFQLSLRYYCCCFCFSFSWNCVTLFPVSVSIYVIICISVKS